MPILVEASGPTADHFTSAISGSPTVVSGLDSLRRELAQRDDEYVVVLGPSVDLEAASALAETLRVTRPALSVVLIRRRLETSILAEALRSGMREVVEERDLAALEGAITRARQIWEAMNGPVEDHAGQHRGRLVTVFSPKGGVGKTTLAVNLAVALAHKGRRRVCVVDLDLGFGDVAITLQLFPARTIADAAALGDDLDAESLRTLVTPHREHVHMLAAPVQPDAKEAISSSLVRRLLELLKTEYDFVVVDTAPAFDEHVLAAFDETDQMLLVTTLDVPALKNLKIAVETLDLLNFPPESRRLVLNRADDRVGLSAGKVESTLNMAITSSIPTSPQVPNATNSGDPIVATSPRHPVSQAVVALAHVIAGETAVASLPRKHSLDEPVIAPPRRGLLRRK